MKPRQLGFTLVELITVMVLMGILAGTFMVFFKPTIDGYFDARRRADLTDIADTALRKIAQDVRRAAPNSVNVIDATTTADNVACVQLVPTVGGGRYRTGPDLTNDDASCPTSGVCAAYPDSSAAASATPTFDVLVSQFSGATDPIVKDATVVINNQNGDDVYDTGLSRGTITNTVAAPPRPGFGTHRVTLSRNPTAGGYDAGRFQIVAAAEASVIYSCSGGRLIRTNVGSFTKQTACPAYSAAMDPYVLATDLKSCEFQYSANMGGQQSGYLWMTIVLERQNEAVTLAHGSHVDNIP
jgi:MSHA biogenesis protein MshO